MYQAAKFATYPDIQQRIAKAPTAKETEAIGRTPGLGTDPGWNAQRVNVMRWALPMKREANEAEVGRGSRRDWRAFDVTEFGALLRFFAGWGMRITFVPEDQVAEQPKTAVHEPEDEGD